MAAPMRTLICVRSSIPVSSYLQVRQKHVNIKHPRPRRIPRRIFDEITSPIYLPKVASPAESCERGKLKPVETEVNPYETFILKRWQTRVFNDTNRLIVLCQPYPMSANDYRDIRVNLRGNGFDMTRANNKLILQTITGTRFEMMQPWFVGVSEVIYSESNDISLLMKLLKKMPSLQVLGGFLEDRLLTKSGLTMAAELPNIELLRGELVSILNMAGGSQTLSLLSSHQQRLTSNLSQYVKQTQEGSQAVKEANSQSTNTNVDSQKPSDPASDDSEKTSPESDKT